MNKNGAGMLQMRREIEKILRPRFPALSDASVRSHAEAAVALLVEAMVRDSELGVSGAVTGEVSIEYSWRVR